MLPASAATLNWDFDGVLPISGGTGFWDTTTPLWEDGAGGYVTWNNATPDNAVFGPSVGTVTLAENITAGAVTINNAGYTIDLAGSDFTIGSIGGVGGNHNATTVTNTNLNTTATFTTGNLGNSGPTLAGNMNVVLNGTTGWSPATPHTFTGTLWLQGSGTVRADDNRYLGSATGLIKLDGSRVLLFGTPIGQTHTFTRDIELIGTTQGLQANGAKQITLTGTVTGSGALRMTSGQGTIVLAGNNDYTGPTSINGQNGILILAHNNALGSSPSFTLASGLLAAIGFQGGITVGDGTPVFLSGSTPTSGLGMVHNFSGDNSFAGTITHNSNTLRTYGAEPGTTLTLTGALTGGKGLAKIGQGTLVLTAQNTFPTANATVENEVAVREGILRLDFSQATWETSPGVQTNIVNNGKVTNVNATDVAHLVLAGGTLQVLGKPDFINSQSFKSGSSTTATNVFTINPGASAVRAIQNDATSITIDLGKLLHAQRKVGGTVDFTLPTAGAIVLPSVPDSVGTSNTILIANGAAFATVDGTDWAALDSGRNIVAGSSLPGFYTPNTATTLTGNADMSSGEDTVLDASTTITSLRFHDSATRVLDLGNQILTTGGILVTGGGNLASAITGGTLRAASTISAVTNQDLVIIQNNRAGELVVSSEIADNLDGTTPATGLTKSGPGKLVLTSPANSYTGETHLNDGIVALQDGGVLGNGKLFFHGGVLGLTGGTTFNRVLNTAAGNNTVQFIGSGGFAAYGGDVTIDIQNTSVPSAPITLNMGGTNGFVPTGSAFVLGWNDSDGTVIVNNPVFLRAANQPQQREIRVHDGSAEVDARLAAGLPGNFQEGGLTKSGDGTLEVAGAAGTYLGPTIIEGGELRVGFTNAIPGTAMTIRAGTFNTNGFNFTPTNGLTMGGGPSGSTAEITTGTGTLSLVTDVIYNGHVANDAGAFISGNVNLGATTRVFTVNNSTATANDLVVFADIFGSGGLRKMGAGTLQLLGTNSYFGPTTVSQGVLGVSGFLSGSSAVLVNGGTLSGTGGVGVVTLTSGSIAPGNSPGILNTGEVFLNGGALELEIVDGTSFDQINVSGGVNFGGPVTLSLSLASALPENTSFTIINNNLDDPVTFASVFAGLVHNGNLLEEGELFDVSGTFGSQAFTISYAAGADFNDVVLTAVPEPGSAVMLLAGLACLVSSQRRRPSRQTW